MSSTITGYISGWRFRMALNGSENILYRQQINFPETRPFFIIPSGGRSDVTQGFRGKKKLTHHVVLGAQLEPLPRGCISFYRYR